MPAGSNWLDTATDWEDFFARIAVLDGTDLVRALQALDLVGDADLPAYDRLKTSAEGRAVPLAAAFRGTDSEVTLLALGFGRGTTGALAVPYAPALAT